MRPIWGDSVTHRKPDVGDVLQFALPDGNFAYGRMLHGASVAFYREVTATTATPPIGSRDYQFIVGVDGHVLCSDEVARRESVQSMMRLASGILSLPDFLRRPPVETSVWVASASRSLSSKRVKNNNRRVQGAPRIRDAREVSGVDQGWLWDTAAMNAAASTSAARRYAWTPSRRFLRDYYAAAIRRGTGSSTAYARVDLLQDVINTLGG